MIITIIIIIVSITIRIIITIITSVCLQEFSCVRKCVRACEGAICICLPGPSHTLAMLKCEDVGLLVISNACSRLMYLWDNLHVID